MNIVKSVDSHPYVSSANRGVKGLLKMLVVIFREILSKFFNDNC